MLIEFSVTNFRSLRDRQTLSLAKAKGDELLDSNTFSVQAANKFELLRSAAIYGPNAGGKSNLLRALQTMKTVVLESSGSRQRGDTLPVTPFRLSEQTREAPSEFEVIFIVNGVRYQYGFSASSERIHEEWLLAYPKGRPQHWFERTWNPNTEQYDWELGNNLSGEKQLWMKSTRDNALFLSTAVQLNSEQLQPLYDWFDDTLRMANISGWGPDQSAGLCASGEKAKIMEFLRVADTNIDDVVVEHKKSQYGGKFFTMHSLPGQARSFDISVLRRSIEDGSTVRFDFKDESDGTRKLFSFAAPWIESLAKGCVLFIDELHDNLHPRLVEFLVRLFHGNDTNPRNAQLVFTTHETSILSQEIFRRDQIWFCEKDQDQATRLYPLTDFSPRKGRENLALAYLSGRYGALPFVRALENNC